jgi:hypothetical protein
MRPRGELPGRKVGEGYGRAVCEERGAQRKSGDGAKENNRRKRPPDLPAPSCTSTTLTKALV